MRSLGYCESMHLRYLHNLGREDAVEVEEVDNEEPWPSVVDQFNADSYVSSNGHVAELTFGFDGPLGRLLAYVTCVYISVLFLIQLLYRKPHMDTMLPSICSILLSDKQDEVASIELAELVGFEEIELVSEIMANRRTAANKVTFILDNL